MKRGVPKMFTVVVPRAYSISPRKETTDQLCGAAKQNVFSNQPEYNEELSSNFESHASNEVSRQLIEESLTQIIQDINSKRKEDMNIVETIKKEIMAQAAHSCQMIDDQMRRMHNSKGKDLDEATKMLMTSLDKVRSMEEDLETSKISLQTLFQEIQKTVFQPLDYGVDDM